MLNLCYDEYGGIYLTPHMVNLVIDSWCKVENMRRAELLAQKMDEEQVIWIRPDQFEGTESEKCYKYPCPNHETYEILAAGWQRTGMADEVGQLRKVFKPGAAAKSTPIPGTRGALEDASSLCVYTYTHPPIHPHAQPHTPAHTCVFHASASLCGYHFFLPLCSCHYLHYWTSPLVFCFLWLCLERV
jgi:hypothetical protein